MTGILAYCVGPAVGAVIGYITNDIAIRMLFKPHTAKYILGMKVPFTPGIIPKEKGRIAKAIGTAISENLMSKEVLEKNLLSDEMVGKIRHSIDEFFAEQKQNDETLRQFLLHYLTEQEVNAVISSINGEMTSQVADKLATAHLGDSIADVVVTHLTNKLRIDGLDIDIPSMVKTLMGGTLWGTLASMVEQPARQFLARNIDQMLQQNGPEIVSNLISTQVEDLSQMPMRRLLEGKDQQIEAFTTSVMSLYRTVITDHLPRILDTIDIPTIIEARINEMDMDETEKLIFQVMDKELKAIVWLGAGLGFIMGFVNSLI